MGSKTLPKQFIFNEKLDKDSLYGLYTDDFEYVEEIFTTILQNFDADFCAIQLAYESGNAEDLKRSVHKMKPVFGFTGLLDIQISCQQFEDKCATAATTTDITGDYIHIKHTLLEAKDLIQSECIRLKAFNANHL